MSYWIKGALILPDRVVENGLVRIDGSRIAGVWDAAAGDTIAYDERRTVRLDGGYLAPGFIDLHVHGGGGADFMDGDPEAVAVITETHARYGTTGLLATTLTAPEEEIIRAVRAAEVAPGRGAQVFGFHIEGPFINAKMKGAMDSRFIRPAAVAEIDRWLAAVSSAHCWQVTLAPEVDGAREAIRHLAALGVVVSAGHTDCTCMQLREACGEGLSHVTHLYNAMRGFHHREPGTVGGALTLPNLTVELIADGIHVDPVALALAVAARGADRIVLITDAMRAAGMPDGEYLLGRQKTIVRDGRAILADGTLAGSVLTMAGAVRNMVQLAGIPLPAAVAMASLNPARRHRLDGRKGSIAVGKDADLVILDRNLEVVNTIIQGRVVFGRDLP